MYDNDNYGRGYYGSYYGNRGHNPSERWDENEFEHHRRQQPQQGGYQARNRYQQQYRQHEPQHSGPNWHSGYNDPRANEPWPHYHDNDGYAHGRPFNVEDRDWFDRAADTFRSWFGDEEAERRHHIDRLDHDAYPRDYYGRRFRWERLKEYEDRQRAAYPYQGPPYGPNVGSDY